MARPNILIIIPHLGPGGAQQVFRDQVKFYRQHANVIPCIFNWDESFPDERTESIMSLDVPAGSTLFGKLRSFRNRIIQLRRIKKARSIDIAISHLEGADYVNVLSSNNDRTILWVHGTKKFDRAITGVLGWVRKSILLVALYRRGSAVVTVSEGIRRELIDKFNIPANKITTIYNGVRLGEVRALAAEDHPMAHYFGNENILITHCRFAAQKNLAALLRIFALTKKKCTARLVILGDGEQRESLLDLSRSLGLSVYSTWSVGAFTDADVYFMGYQQNPFPFLARATLYAMPSDWEGFPLALCEAMACGLPVLAADCYTGPREILTPGNTSPQPVETSQESVSGMLLPLADSPAHEYMWANAICALMSSGPIREAASRGSLERVAAFDMRHTEQKWLKIIS